MTTTTLARFCVPEYGCFVSSPSETAVKTLFAHSRNKCFFTRCEEDLTREGWKQVNAEIAHISGEHPGSARYDPDQPDEDRQGFENLMLLCPKHHKRIDRLEPEKYPVAVLSEMREKHLEHDAEKDWCTEDDALRFAQLAIAYWTEQKSLGLHIVSAAYGADATYADVTESVARQIVGDRLTMEVTNETMGGDPIENVVKELRVRYLHNGQEHEEVVAENQTFSLPWINMPTTNQPL